MMAKGNYIENFIYKLWEAGLAGKPGVRGDLRHVRMWVRDKGRCVYCGTNLLGGLIEATSAQLDHILPKAKYEGYKENEENWALACFCCNQIKRKFDPYDYLADDRKPGLNSETLKKYRPELLEICRAYLIPQLKKREEIRNQINDILANENMEGQIDK